MREIEIDLLGPYSFVRGSTSPSVFDSPSSNSAGVYIWTVPFKDSELVHYVGETGKSYKERLFDHLKNYFSGVYCINEPAEMLKGERVRIWVGTGRGAKIQDFLERYDHYSKKVMELIQVFRIYLLPLDCERKLRRRIEGIIAQSLYEQEGVVGDFQEPDCSYQKPMVDGGPWRVRLNFEARILGLRKEYTV